MHISFLKSNFENLIVKFFNLTILEVTPTRTAIFSKKRGGLQSIIPVRASFEKINLSGNPSFISSNTKNSCFFYGPSYLNTFFSHFRTVYKGSLKPFFIKFFMKGVGYRVWFRRNQLLFFKLGFTHKLSFYLPKGIICKVHKYKFLIFSFNKEKLSQMARFLLSLRFPDIYKGKGIRYSNDRVPFKSRLKDAKKRLKNE